MVCLRGQKGWSHDVLADKHTLGPASFLRKSNASPYRGFVRSSFFCNGAELTDDPRRDDRGTHYADSGGRHVTDEVEGLSRALSESFYLAAAGRIETSLYLKKMLRRWKAGNS